MNAEQKSLKLWKDAKARVLGEGRKTGKEFVRVYDVSVGRVLADSGGDSTDRVRLPESIRLAAEDRHSTLGVHHNHPNSSGLTVADLEILSSYPGIRAVIAHAHDGCDYVALTRERGNIAKQALCIERALLRVLHRDPAAALLHAQGVLTKLRGHLLGLALCSCGVIDYRAYLTPETQALYAANLQHLDSWVRAVVISCPVERRI